MRQPYLDYPSSLDIGLKTAGMEARRLDYLLAAILAFAFALTGKMHAFYFLPTSRRYPASTGRALEERGKGPASI